MSTSARALYVEVADVGRRVRTSKKRVTWRFIFEDSPKEHTVVLKHSVLSGKKSIEFDGREVHQSQKILSSEFEHGFSVPSHLLRVTIVEKLDGYYYNLYVDGTPFGRLPRESPSSVARRLAPPTVEPFDKFVGRRRRGSKGASSSGSSSESSSSSSGDERDGRARKGADKRRKRRGSKHATKPARKSDARAPAPPSGDEADIPPPAEWVAFEGGQSGAGAAAGTSDAGFDPFGVSAAKPPPVDDFFSRPAAPAAAPNTSFDPFAPGASNDPFAAGGGGGGGGSGGLSAISFAGSAQAYAHTASPAPSAPERPLNVLEQRKATSPADAWAMGADLVNLDGGIAPSTPVPASSAPAKTARKSNSTATAAAPAAAPAIGAAPVRGVPGAHGLAPAFMPPRALPAPSMGAMGYPALAAGPGMSGAPGYFPPAGMGGMAGPGMAAPRMPFPPGHGAPMGGPGMGWPAGAVPQRPAGSVHDADPFSGL